MSNRYWNKYEYALLLETCLNLIDGKVNSFTACDKLSKNLRAMAINQGEKISDAFRNFNGMSWQISLMREALSGRSRSKLHCGVGILNIIDLYRNNRAEYNAILAEAHRKINASNLTKEEGVNYMEDFKGWLGERIGDASKVAKIVDVFDRMSNVFKNYQKYKCRIWDIADVQAYRACVDELSSNNYIRHAFASLLSDFKAVAHFYEDYLQSVSNADSINVSVVNNSDENIEIISLDSNEPINLAHTKPLRCQYDGATYLVGSWTELYVLLLDKFVQHNLLIFQSWCRKEYSLIDGQAPDFCFFSRRQILRKAAAITNNMYVETSIGAGDMFLRLKNIYAQLNVKAKPAPIIYYTHKSVATAKVTVVEPKAQVSSAPSKNSIADPEQYQFEIDGGTVFSIDFENIGDYSYTKPVDFSYKGRAYPAKSWHTAYVLILRLLRNEYKKEFYAFSAKEISLVDGKRPDFCLESRKDILRDEVFIGSGSYAEANHSATDLVRRIKAVFALCNADINDLIIHYTFREGAPSDAIAAAIKMQQKRLVLNAVAQSSANIPQEDTLVDQNANLVAESSNEIADDIKDATGCVNDGFVDDINERLESALRENYDGVPMARLKEMFTDCSTKRINAALENCGAVYVNNKYYHKDNIFDYDAMADVLLQILTRQFDKNGGFTSSSLLYQEAHARLSNFFFNNDGCFDTEKEVFDLAKQVFSVDHYRGRNFVFVQGKYIWEKEPDYTKDATGLLLKFGRDNGGIFNKESALEFLKSIGSDNPGGLFSNITLYRNQDKIFLQYGPYDFILKERIGFSPSQIEIIIANLNNLLADQDYIAAGSISEEFYDMMPPLPSGAYWSLFFIKSISELYDLGIVVFRASSDDDTSTLPAAIVRKNSDFTTFADVVWTEWSSMGLPNEMTADAFREFLCNAGFIRQTEKLHNVHKTVAEDSRFLWTENNNKVIISK